MDAMTMAKKQVLKDLIKDMHKRMTAMDAPEGSKAEEAVETQAEEKAEGEDGGEDSEEMKVEDEALPPPKKPVTITLAAIKKGLPPALKGKGDAPSEKMPSALEDALMGKEKEKLKRKG